MKKTEKNEVILVSSNSIKSLKEKTLEILKSELCSKDCKSCKNCFGLESKNSFNTLFFSAPVRYVLEQINLIAKKMSFKLSEKEKFFFIIENAERLSLACANRLLKSLEEPKSGYNFILTTQNSSLIIPTVRSRCKKVFNISSEGQVLKKEKILEFFEKKITFSDIDEFEKILNSSFINESTVSNFLEDLILKNIDEYKKNFFDLEKRTFFQEKITNLNALKLKSPVSGGIKNFLRVLFLNLASEKKTSGLEKNTQNNI